MLKPIGLSVVITIILVLLGDSVSLGGFAALLGILFIFG